MSLRDPNVDAVMNTWEKDLIFKSTWRGVVAVKNPADAWVYQELIYRLKPEFILETGTFKGGSALFLADMQRVAGVKGEVWSIDVRQYGPYPVDERVHYIISPSSVDPNTVAMIHREAAGKRCLVILDSDHDAPHVAKELEAYHDLVKPGEYLIVEDTWWRPGNGGPYDAVVPFLEKHPEFKTDESCDRYKFTNNPRGFLYRV